jgi:photosystem II stability/assembly factor-like uncharacterized protein
MNKKLAMLAIAVLATTMAFGQPWLQNIQKDQAGTSSVNIYELRDAFHSHFEGKDQGKGTGYKQFQRYLAFMEPRVYPSGVFQEDALWKAYRTEAATRLKSGNYTANWTPLGPFDVPAGLNGGKTSGVGRINCIAFHPTDPNLFYVGAPSGGVWKTTDGGTNWSTTTDQLPALGVSDIGINLLNPNILYVVTGDKDGGNTCPTYSFGILKSNDAGATWEETGLVHETSSTIRMRRILVHPTNPDILITAGGPGIYRSTDAGATWTQVSTGNYFDLEFKPNDPTILYACSSNSIFKSTDTGLTFESVSEGLPSSGVGRIEMAVTQANPSVIYAVLSNSESGFKGLYKSSDSGATWVAKSTEAEINIFSYEANGSGGTGIAWYAIALAVDQQDENTVYSGSVNLWKSTNSGTSWTLSAHWYGANGKPYVHADEHTLVVNPLNNICYSGNDGGIYKTTDKGTTWTDISEGLSILQIYRMGASASNPQLILEGSQDNGTYLYTNGTWNDVRGGDGMECAFDPVDPSICYSTTQNGEIAKSTNGGRDWRSIKPEEKGAWITPFQISQINHNVLVAGYKSVYLTTTYGNTWMKISGELAGGDYMNEIAFAPSDDAFIYVSSGSRIWGTRDYGSNWKSLNNGLPNLTIEGIQVSASEPEKVWIAFSGYSEGQKVYFSDDGGDSWINYSDGLPNVPANCLMVNKLSKYAVYAGTDLGVYYRNPGMSEWVPFDDGLPNVIVNELDINYKINKIRAATFGRGIWESPVIDDGNWPPALQLSASELPTQITLSWFAPTERQPLSYSIYRDTVLIASSSTNTYTDQVENGRSYTYQVVAVYEDGESTPTNKLRARGIIQVTFPYRQDFSTEAHGWLLKDEPSGWQWGTGIDFKMNLLGTSKFIAISSEIANTVGKHASGYALLPKMDISNLTSPVITCKYSLRRWLDLDHLYLVYRSYDNPTWTTLAEIIPTGRVWSWKSFNFSIPEDLLIQDIEFAFYYTDNSGIGYGAAIDDVYIGPDISGTGESALKEKIAFYPNPTDGIIHLRLEGFDYQKARIEVLDASGKIIRGHEISLDPTGSTDDINLRKEAPGMYYLRIIAGDNQWVKPVIRK